MGRGREVGCGLGVIPGVAVAVGVGVGVEVPLGVTVGEGCQISKRLRRANRRFQFQKRRQSFIRTHNEAFSVIAMCVCNPDGSPGGINR